MVDEAEYTTTTIRGHMLTSLRHSTLLARPPLYAFKEGRTFLCCTGVPRGAQWHTQNLDLLQLRPLGMLLDNNHFTS